MSTQPQPDGQFILYQTKSVISRHIKNIYSKAELQTSATVANFAYLEQVNDDLDCTYPHCEVHNVLCTAMRNKARSAAWQTELELMK